MLELADQGTACYLLVPEQSTLESESQVIKEGEILQESGRRGLLDIQVVSFRKLGNLLLKKTDLRTKTLLKEKGQLMILSKVLRELGAQGVLRLYAKPRENVLSELLRVVLDLCDLDGEHGELTEGEALEGSPGLKEKLRELLLIKEGYLRLLGDGFVDDGGWYDRLAAAVRETGLFRNARIYVDDFYRLSNRQVEVLKALMESSASFTVALPADAAEPELFSIPLELLERLRSHCQRNGIASDLIRMEEPRYGCPELAFLESRIGRIGQERFSGTVGKIALVKTPNIDLEVKHLFQEIIRMVDSGQCRFREIRVVCNDLDAYRNALKLGRKLYDVPMFIDEKVPLHSHPLVRLILGILDLRQENHTETILDLMRTGYLGFTDEEVERLEIYVRANGIRYGKWNREFQEDPDCEAVRVKIMALLESLRKEDHGGSLREQIIALYRNLESLGIHEILEGKIEGFKAQENYNNVYIHTQLWNLVLDTFDQLASFLGEEQADPKELASLLAGSLGRERLSILPVRSDEVLVIGSADAFKEKAKAVFLLGASEGQYPERITSDPLFPLEEGELLERLLDWKKDDASKQARKRMEYYQTLSMAGESLSISYSLSDAQGDPQMPSTLVRQLKKLFPGLKEKEVLEEDEGYFYSRETALIRFIRDSLAGSVVSGRSRYRSIREHYGTLLDNLFRFQEDEGRDGQVAEALVRMALLRDGSPAFSLSKLEAYGACPYKFFVSAALRPREEQEYELRSLDLGTLYHNLLDKVGRQDWLADHSPESRRELVGEMIRSESVRQGLDRLDSNALLYQMDRIREEGGDIVEFLLEEQHQDGFKLRCTELGFGEGEPVEPYRLSLPDGTLLSMEGRVDRVDVFETDGERYVRVLDYKLKGRKLDLQKVRDGISFQLFLYLKALLASGGKVLGSGLRAGGLLYAQLVRDPATVDLASADKNGTKRLGGILLDDPVLLDNVPRKLIRINKMNGRDFELLGNRIDEKLREHGEGILKGDFRAAPYYYKSDSTACTYCSYLGICRNRDQYRVLKRTADADVLKELRGRQGGSDDPVDNGTAAGD